MKKIILVSTLFMLTFSQFVNAQITNTFPLDDSVGIGTTIPQDILDVRNGNINIQGMTVGAVSGGLVIGSLNFLNNTTGNFNYAIGGFTLKDNTSGSDNIGLGDAALQQNTSGNLNIAIGNHSLFNNVEGIGNTAVGSSALYSNKNGNSNTAIGIGSMTANIKGDYCASVGDGSLGANTKGDFNTALGALSLDFNKSGNNNTALGYNADVSAINLSNATAIGSNALVDASNKVRIGNASITSNGGQVEWTAYSDARIKTDVQENVPGLEFINLLKPITYHFDVDKQNQLSGANTGEKQDGMYDIEKIQFTGFLAQDVEAAAKKINYDFSGVDKSGDIIGLRYSSFVVPMVKAIQELSDENSSLQSSVGSLQKENDDLEKRISKLEKLITKQGIVLSDETTAQEISTTKVTLEQADAANELPTLAQNIPNPFTGKTSISYYVPVSATSAQIKIANSNGQSLFFADVKLGAGVLEIEASQLAAGTYSYTLIIDGKVMDTKLMVIQR